MPCAEEGLKVALPSPGYCSDNAAMIAGLGWHHWQAGELAELSLDAMAR